MMMTLVAADSDSGCGSGATVLNPSRLAERRAELSYASSGERRVARRDFVGRGNGSGGGFVSLVTGDEMVMVM